MNTHEFRSTAAAYDACQCDENIQDGDILLIESERVVGVAHTWPFAVTTTAGQLHHLRQDITDDEVRAIGRAEVFPEAIAAAKRVAAQYGFPAI